MRQKEKSTNSHFEVSSERIDPAGINIPPGGGCGKLVYACRPLSQSRKAATLRTFLDRNLENQILELNVYDKAHVRSLDHKAIHSANVNVTKNPPGVKGN